MKTRIKKLFLAPALAAGLGLMPAGPVYGSLGTWTWNGEGADNMWTTPANWSPLGFPHTGDNALFGGSVQLNPYNNNSGLEVSEIVFNAGSGAFTLNGNGISVGGAGGIVNNSAVTQTINMPVTLTAAETFKPAYGPLVFAAIDGVPAVTFSGPYTVTLTGPLGASTPPAGLGGLAPITLSGGLVATKGDQVYSQPLTLGAATLMTSGSGALTLGSSVNGPYGLTLAGTATSVEGSVGQSMPLSSLTINGPATVSGGTLNTTGSQTYEALTLGAATLMTSGSGALILGSSVDGGYGLTLAGSATSLGGPVGQFIPLKSLTINGPATVSGGTLNTTGSQTYEALTLGAATLMTSGSGALILGSSVDGGYGLTLAGTATSVGGPVGQFIPLKSLTINGPATVSGGTLNTTGSQTYEALTLGAATLMTSGSGALILGSSVDGGYGLTLAGTATSVGGPVGQFIPLKSLTINGPATVFAGILNTTGSQTYEALTLGAATLMTSGSGALILGSSVDGGYRPDVSWQLHERRRASGPIHTAEIPDYQRPGDGLRRDTQHDGEPDLRGVDAGRRYVDDKRQRGIDLRLVGGRGVRPDVSWQRHERGRVSGPIDAVELPDHQRPGDGIRRDTQHDGEPDLRTIDAWRFYVDDKLERGIDPGLVGGRGVRPDVSWQRHERGRVSGPIRTGELPDHQWPGDGIRRDIQHDGEPDLRTVDAGSFYVDDKLERGIDPGLVGGRGVRPDVSWHHHERGRVSGPIDAVELPDHQRPGDGIRRDTQHDGEPDLRTVDAWRRYVDDKLERGIDPGLVGGRGIRPDVSWQLHERGRASGPIHTAEIPDHQRSGDDLRRDTQHDGQPDLRGVDAGRRYVDDKLQRNPHV